MSGDQLAITGPGQTAALLGAAAGAIGLGKLALAGQKRAEKHEAAKAATQRDE